MKRILIFVAVIGIGLFLGISIRTTAIAASDTDTWRGPVAFDGKSIIFPKGTGLAPFDISHIEFGDLSGAPEFLKIKNGKVSIIEFQFNPNGNRNTQQRRRSMGLYRIGVFTKWTEGIKEMFFYPPVQKGDGLFLDCVASNNGEHECTVRDRTFGNTYRMSFQGSKITINTVGDGASAESRIAGEIPVPPPAQSQTSPSQP